jgi:FixJ family two-component response regulator
VVIDLSMPGLDGLELQRAMAKKAGAQPVVFITGQGSVASSVEAMKAGAVDFLTKPFDEQQLLGAVSAAVEKDRSARGAHAERAATDARLAGLHDLEVLAIAARDGRLLVTSDRQTMPGFSGSSSRTRRVPE